MSCILLIDDEPTLRDIYRQLLIRAGYEVCEACDGGEGLQQFQTHSRRPGVDRYVPAQAGWLCTPADPPDADPHCQNCGHVWRGQMGGTDLLTRAASLGADRIIQKPIPLRDLLAMVRELLGGLRAF